MTMLFAHQGVSAARLIERSGRAGISMVEKAREEMKVLFSTRLEESHLVKMWRK